jgi:hypothetical protein
LRVACLADVRVFWRAELLVESKVERSADATAGMMGNAKGVMKAAMRDHWWAVKMADSMEILLDVVLGAY